MSSQAIAQKALQVMDMDYSTENCSTSITNVSFPAPTFATYVNRDFEGPRQGFNNIERSCPCVEYLKSKGMISNLGGREVSTPSWRNEPDGKISNLTAIDGLPSHVNQNQRSCPPYLSPVCNCARLEFRHFFPTSNASALIAEKYLDPMEAAPDHAFQGEVPWEEVGHPIGNTSLGQTQQPNAFSPNPWIHPVEVEGYSKLKDIHKSESTHLHEHEEASRLALSSPSSSPSETLSSSSTYIQITIPEERYSLIQLIYHTCLDASKVYLEAAISSPPFKRRRRFWQNRFAPYPTMDASYGTARSLTLMDYIRDISSHLWRRAKADVMAPHRAESQAAKDMHDLYVWGEIIVNGFEGQTIGVLECRDGEYVMVDDEEDTILGKDIDEDVKVAVAAERLCEWMGDDDRVNFCQDARERLEGLAVESRVGGDKMEDAISCLVFAEDGEGVK